MSELAELTQVSATGILGAQAFEPWKKEVGQKEAEIWGTVSCMKIRASIDTWCQAEKDDPFILIWSLRKYVIICATKVPLILLRS